MVGSKEKIKGKGVDRSEQNQDVPETIIGIQKNSGGGSA
jgi:hypothetical protein